MYKGRNQKKSKKGRRVDAFARTRTDNVDIKGLFEERALNNSCNKSED